ncbi:MAG: type VII secretion-associated protein [Mycobacterium sp.]
MTVLEVGPAAVRRLSPGGEPQLDDGIVAQALAGIDETTVLLDERPVTVDSLWRHIVSSCIGDHCGPVTLVHPSWWPPRRVARAVDAATSVAAEVLATPRSALIAGHQRDAATTVVELADDIVAICAADGSIRRLARSDDASAVVSGIAEGHILIDAPHGVHGAQELAAALRKALVCRGLSAAIVRLEERMEPPTAEAAPADPVRRSWLSARAVAAALVGIVVCGVGVATTRPSGSVSVLRADSADLVEGRVSLRIPAGWTVTRVTAGPGSRRVEIASPVDHRVVLHLTQSYAPEQTLDTTAQTLRRALAEEPAGTFVDFDPDNRRAGRAAVTYREVRTGHHIRWSVFVDGATRIGIGCQSGPGDENAIDAACDDAIRSARDLVGTPRPS